jgi:hypothetical protein
MKNIKIIYLIKEDKMQIKKSVAVFIVMILAVVGLNSNQALAAELSSYSTEVNFDNQETNSKGTFEFIKTNNNRATFPGNGGTCSLEYLSSGKYIWWQVQPAIAAPITVPNAIITFTY